MSLLSPRRAKPESREPPASHCLTSIPIKVMEQVAYLETASSIKYRKVIVSSQHGFTKGKSRFTNLTAFFDDRTRSVE